MRIYFTPGMTRRLRACRSSLVCFLMSARLSDIFPMQKHAIGYIFPICSKRLTTFQNRINPAEGAVELLRGGTAASTAAGPQSAFLAVFGNGIEVSVGLGFGYYIPYRLFVDVAEDAGRMVAEPHLALIADCQRAARQVCGAV